MDDFSSHLKILEFIIDNFNVKTIFESGMGNFSTKLFIEKAEKVVSLDNSNQSWFEEINKKYEGRKNFIGVLKLQYQGIYDFIDALGNFDMAFVDGRAGDRWRVGNHLLKKSPITIFHYSQATCYNYEKVIIPFGYLWIDVIDFDPWTSVLTNNIEVFRALQKNFQIEVYDTRSFPNKRYLIDNKNALTPNDLLVLEGKL